MKVSIMQPEYPYKGRIPVDATCYFCRKPAECRHHVYPGYGRREVCENNGLWVYLCNDCHNMSLHSVHFDRETDRELRVEVQRKYEETHTRDEFMALVGVNYLD